ncbi:uncharacterized protein V5649_009128 [Rhynchonycteris naso]
MLSGVFWVRPLKESPRHLNDCLPGRCAGSRSEHSGGSRGSRASERAQRDIRFRPRRSGARTPIRTRPRSVCSRRAGPGRAGRVQLFPPLSRRGAAARNDGCGRSRARWTGASADWGCRSWERVAAGWQLGRGASAKGGGEAATPARRRRARGREAGGRGACQPPGSRGAVTWRGAGPNGGGGGGGRGRRRLGRDAGGGGGGGGGGAAAGGAARRSAGRRSAARRFVRLQGLEAVINQTVPDATRKAEHLHARGSACLCVFEGLLCTHT